MADRIGVARRWWQSPQKTSGSHYDIALSKREAAVAAGAVEITWRQAGCMNIRRKSTGALGNPLDAEEWVAQAMKNRKSPKPGERPVVPLTGDANPAQTRQD
jgi:hypothetical protein